MSQIPQSRAPSRSDLPVWETVCASYRKVFVENLNHLPNAVVGPLVLSLVIGALLVASGADLLTRKGGASALGAIAFIILLFAALVPYVIFAVAWHRVILLGPAAAPPTVIPTWRDRHWRFYGYSLLIGLLGLLLFLVIVGVPLLIVYYAVGSRLLQGLTGFIAGIAALAIIFRLCLVLPATAVDERYGLGDAMRQSAGQGLRFVAAVILIGLPFVAADVIARWLLLSPSPDVLNSTAGIAVVLVLGMIWLGLHTIISYLESAVVISFLSLAFRHLSGWRPADTEKAASPPAGDASFDTT